MSGARQDDAIVMQNALHDEELHKTLLDQLDEAIYIVDRDGRVLYWNRAAERVTGYLTHEVTGRVFQQDLLMLGDSDGSPAGGPDCPLTAVLESGGRRETTAFLKHKEGHRIPVRVQARAICDLAGAVIGAMEGFEETHHPEPVDYAQLKTYGCIDELTDLASRSFGEMKMAHALDAYHRFGIPFGWLRVELDDLAGHLQRFGPGMIDAATRMLARTLDQNIDPTHLVSYWGKAEFRVQVYSGGRRKLADLAEQLIQLVRASTVEWWGDTRSVTISAAGSLPQAGDTPEALEARVAEAFGNCRASGGNRSAIANSEWRVQPGVHLLGGH